MNRGLVWVASNADATIPTPDGLAPEMGPWLLPFRLQLGRFRSSSLEAEHTVC